MAGCLFWPGSLLSTAAVAYGERLTAVILTGSGSDCAAGVVDVKNAGGTSGYTRGSFQ